MTNQLESCRIAPPPCAVADQSLPLSFLDIIWLPFNPIRRLLFYKFPCSKPYFLKTLLPNLKQSLSLTLKHFFPLAGNLVHPLNPDKQPEIRYRAGDSVSLIIIESTSDFDNLVRNHARNADNFYDFIPQLPPVIHDSDHKLHEVLALKVTLFPGRGVCIGFSNHHGVGDATSIVGFIRCWASFNKLRGEDEFLINQGESLPVFDRSLIPYPPELDSTYWNEMKEIPTPSPSFLIPTNKVRATFVLTRSELEKLKNLVQARIPGLLHVSSFVVMAAYVWTCLAKSVSDDELELFLFAVDCRARLDPKVPGSYFGNCLSYGLAKIRHQELVGNEGFVLAAEAIAEEIENRVINNKKILEGAEEWITEMGSIVDKQKFAVSGSARVDLYSVDFGWGKATKVEMLSIDGENYTMSLCKSRDYEGGLEIGLSLPKVKMESFTALFSDGIKGG